MSICKLGDDFTTTTINQAKVWSFFADRDKKQAAAVAVITANESGKIYLGADRGINGKWACYELGHAKNVRAYLTNEGSTPLDVDRFNKMIERACIAFESNSQGRGNCIDMQRQTGLSIKDGEPQQFEIEIKSACKMNPGAVGNAILRACDAAAPRSAKAADPAELEQARKQLQEGTALLNEARAQIEEGRQRDAAAQQEIEQLRQQLAAAQAGQPQRPSMTPEAKRAAAWLKRGYNVYMVGPSGCGKSYTARQIAEANGWLYRPTNAVKDQYSQLVGFTDAQGAFHAPAFARGIMEAASGKHVLFFLDELDASDPAELIALDGFLSGDEIEINGTQYRPNEFCHVLAAANTNGSGATDQFTARYNQDAAALNRWQAVHFGYSEAVELKITGGNRAAVDMAHAIREAADALKVPFVCSYRNVKALAAASEIAAEEGSETAYAEALYSAVFWTTDRETRSTIARRAAERTTDRETRAALQAVANMER